jgi:hypothetical protein
MLGSYSRSSVWAAHRPNCLRAAGGKGQTPAALIEWLAEMHTIVGSSYNWTTRQLPRDVASSGCDSEGFPIKDYLRQPTAFTRMGVEFGASISMDGDGVMVADWSTMEKQQRHPALEPARDGIKLYGGR